MTNRVLASVIIPAYNEEKDIGNCLKSLKNQSYKKLEVIVVDDGSTDQTKEIVKKFKSVKLIQGTHKGPGESRNIGAKKAEGSILIFVDADMTFDKNYIKNLIKPILEDKTGKIIGTTHDYEIATNVHNVYGSLYGKVRVSREHAKDVKIFRAIRKNKFLELGGFDSVYGYADDQTFWFKYKIKPVVAENTICYHKNPETLNATFKQARWIGTSWKERFLIFKIPILSQVLVLLFFFLLPIIILLKVLLMKIKIKFSCNDLIKYYSCKFTGYAMGAFRAVYLGKVWK